jgi:hypothetical protein
MFERIGKTPTLTYFYNRPHGEGKELKQTSRNDFSFRLCPHPCPLPSDGRGWANLDFSDKEELTQLKRLHETLQKEIAAITESLKELRESPDYELCQLAEQKPGILDELAAERAKQLEIENAELEKQAERLAKEIKRLGGTEKIV